MQWTNRTPNRWTNYPPTMPDTPDTNASDELTTAERLAKRPRSLSFAEDKKSVTLEFDDGRILLISSETPMRVMWLYA